jgi:TatD DNase family protein
MFTPPFLNSRAVSFVERAGFIDTHCHLDFPQFDNDRDKVIKSAKSEGIDYIINIGSSLEGSQKSLELSQRYDFIYPTVGMHPHEADRFNPGTLKELESLVKNNKVVAIGEIGLDYFKGYSKKENQIVLFKSLLNLAKEMGLPVVVHNRSASEDTLKILKETLPIKTVLHCFSGDDNFLSECLNLGFFISFTCNITYKKAQDLRNLVKIASLERLLLETDAPFLPPQDLRGKRNEPIYIKYLAQEIARIKGMGVEEVAKITTKNAKNFFNLK